MNENVGTTSAEEIQRAQLHLQHYSTTLSIFTPELVQASEAATSLAQMTINSLIVLNAGVLAALPSLLLSKDHISGPWVAYTPMTFLSGLIAAILCAGLVVMNYMAISKRFEAIRNARLARTVEMDRLGKSFKPSAGLEMLELDANRNRIVGNCSPPKERSMRRTDSGARG